MESQLSTIAIHDPLRLTDRNFLESFVAREDLFSLILNQLRKVKPNTEVPKHHLIVGQRGMGKTSLLRRISIGIEEDAELHANFIPLAFREEQYDVRNLARLWRNCMESLADRLETQGEDQRAAELDQMIGTVDWTDSRTAYECLEDAISDVGKRPVLLLDNADMILNSIEEDEQWEFRGVLQARHGPLLIAASTQHMEMSANPNAAFYEFFRIWVLEPLSANELTLCLRRLARSRGEKGTHALAVIDKEPQRIRALHSLTGGNPRTLALIYQLLESDESDAVFSDLERLFDNLTPIYKARVEELSGHQRAVFDAIALHWDPVSIAKLAELTALASTSLSSHLTRLIERGLIIQSKSSRASNNYLLAERFFNIWYLMRHGTRRARRRVKWLTAFLTSYYAPDERNRLAERLLDQRAFEASSHIYLFAVSEALQDLTLGRALKQKLSEEINRQGGTRRAVSRIVRLEELNPVIAERDDLWAKVQSVDNLSDHDAHRFWDSLMSIVGLTWSEKAAVIDRLPAMEPEEVASFQKIAEREEQAHRSIIGDTGYQDIREALKKHHMKDATDMEGAFAVTKRLGRPHAALLAASPISRSMRAQIDRAERENAINLAVESSTDDAPEVQLLVGRALRDSGLFHKAEAAFRHAIEIDENYAHGWIHLGIVLADHLSRYEDAEVAFPPRRRD